MNLEPNIVTDPTAGMSVYNPKSNGTSIVDILKAKEAGTGVGVGANGSTSSYSTAKIPFNNQNNANSLQNDNNFSMRYNEQSKYNNDYNIVPQSHNSSHGSSHGSSRDSPYNSPHDSSIDDLDKNSIKELASNINQSLLALEKLDKSKKKSKKNRSIDENSSTLTESSDSDDKIVLETMSTVNDENNYVKSFVELLLLLTLYVVMSQPFVLSFMTNYIHQLNPNDEGVIGMSGIIIYGLILTILFFVIRRIILSRI